MKNGLLKRALLAVACGLIPGLVSAASLSWVPSSQSIVRGQVTYMDLRISGLIDDSVWYYFVNVFFDPAVVQLVLPQFGDGAGGNQLSCPGPTPETCTHIGGPVWVTSSPGYYALSEAASGENWNPSLDQVQLNDFVLLHLAFKGLEEGTTMLMASDFYYLTKPLIYDSDAHALPNTTAQIDVQLPEPASWLLALSGLAGLLAHGRVRKRAGRS